MAALIFIRAEFAPIWDNVLRSSMTLPALYTPGEVATHLKVTRKTVYQWLTRGSLEGLRIGQSWRITEEQLIGFLKQRPANQKGRRQPARHPQSG